MANETTPQGQNAAARIDLTKTVEQFRKGLTERNAVASKPQNSVIEAVSHLAEYITPRNAGAVVVLAGLYWLATRDSK